jgi:hypothetical protein
MIPGRVCKSEVRTIEAIRYNDRGRGGATNSHLNIQVESDFIPHAPGSYDGTVLLTLFKDQIAKAFHAAINCRRNQYHAITGGGWTFLPTKCWEFANTGDWYQVALIGLPATFSAVPHLRVKITFNGKTTEGAFDCKGSETSVWNKIDNHRIEQYARAMQVPMNAAVTCGDKDGKGKITGDKDCWPNGCYDPQANCLN